MTVDSDLSPRSNSSITLHLGRLRDSIGLLFGLAMVLFGVWLLTTRNYVIIDRFSGGVASCCLGGLIVLGSIVEILIYRLELSEEGFRVHHIHFYYAFSYHWGEVSHFVVFRIWGIPFVCFNRAARWERKIHSLPPLISSLFFMVPYDHSFFVPFGLTSKELAATLNEWRDYHRETAKHTCPCCGYRTFPDPPGSETQCYLCGWKDILEQLLDPQLKLPEQIPLFEAQAFFDQHQASSANYLPVNDEPLPEELKDSLWRPFDRSIDTIQKFIPEVDPSEMTEQQLSKLYYWRPSSRQ